MNLEDLQHRNTELEILHTIARHLNQEVELSKALTTTLQYSIELMKMRTGWIWLLHPTSNSVFLAASHHLPPAFTQHPERLSGWCYCIDKYLANNLESAANISEITCTRLKDLEKGTEGLRHHATIPLFSGSEKIGMMNIMGEGSGRLNENQLELLRVIGDLLSVAIGRTRLFENSKQTGVMEERNRLAQNIRNSLITDMEKMLTKLEQTQSFLKEKKDEKILKMIQQAKKIAEKNITTAQQTILDLSEKMIPQPPSSKLQYPYTPLTERELEVLDLLKKGKTNKAIAAELFIAERTVKFHVSAILGKLQASNRTDAVQIAVKRGIVQF